MEALILDQNFELLTILDSYESFIWTERYREYGDFELYMIHDPKIMPYLAKKNYIMLNESDKLMIIEHIKVETAATELPHVTITGRSLESIVGKRIVWNHTILNGNFQTGIKTLLDSNIISPSDQKRKISNFDFVPSTSTKITSKTIDTQFFGENLYDVINTLCETENIGFKVWLENKRFKFMLYAGEDRSYAQDKLPWVVFSPSYDNIENSTYDSDETNYANASLVVGEEKEGEGQVLIEVTLDDSAGLKRQEIFTDASGVTSTTYDEEGNSSDMTPEEYASQLANKGLEDLGEYSEITTFEGQIDATRQFIYGKDFKMGDIVQVVNEYGMEARSQVVELIRSQDINGYKVIPTFVSLEEE